MYKFFLLFCSILPLISWGKVSTFDTDECSNSVYRSWWDVQHYDLHLKIISGKEKIKGFTIIRAKVVGNPKDSLQIDLQNLLKISSVKYGEKSLKFIRKNNHYFVVGDFKQLKKGEVFELVINYAGVPTIAKNPPWDGGFVIDTSTDGKPWIAVACQGIGASSWWPCKDYAGDEPDFGVDLYYETSSILSAIGNGRLIESIKKGKNTISHWRVVNPINLYDVTFYIGDYVHWSDTLIGEKGILDLNYYVLRENFERAKLQFAVVKQMIHCFEFWLGPYPFYEDGYKLVESPYLGMEHQSAVAYGNDYKMGYYGVDRSHTGVGLLFDFIIVHESAHEWFGNSISVSDVAYSWIQEGFTTYCESIFGECAFGKERATTYQLGQWNIISNKSPIEGVIDMCDGGSVDQYEKASAIIHMIRQVINNDEEFRQLLRALNKTFYHQTVDGPTVEKFINDFTKHDFTNVFDQYLRTTQIPRLAFKMSDSTLSYRWDNIIDEFDMPVLIQIDEDEQWLFPTNLWQEIPLKAVIDLKTQVKIDPNFLVRKKVVD